MCFDGSQFAFREDSDVDVIAFVGKEGSYTSSSTRRVVVCEFGKGKDFQPIVLLVVAENAKVLRSCRIWLRKNVGKAQSFRGLEQMGLGFNL